MKRIIMSNGPYTSILVCNLIDKSENTKNYLIGYYSYTEQSLTNKSDKQLLIESLYNLYDEIIDLKTVIKKNKVKVIDKEKIVKKFGSDIDEVYIPIHTSTRKWIPQIRSIYPQSKIILYEEGLLSYIKPILDKKLRKQIKTTEANYFLFYDSKLKELLKSFLPYENIKAIDPQKVKQSFLDFSKNLKAPKLSDDPSAKYAIILPQYYFNKKSQQEKFDKLILGYKKNIDYFIKQGYKVIIKEHPRMKFSLYNSLKGSYEENTVFTIPELDSYPVETILPHYNIQAAFSVYSTSLFSIRQIYNIPTYTCYDMCDERIGLRSIYPSLTCLLARKLIPDLQSNYNNKNKDFNDIKFNDIFTTESSLINLKYKLLKLID